MPSILPRNATPVEATLEDSANPIRRIGASPALMIGWKYKTPPDPRTIPFLIAEYGLGEISSFVPNVEQLLAQGIDWQRIRGTPAAVALGLSWLVYTATIETAPLRRLRWNTFQLALNQFRANEVPDLGRVEGITGLSVPLRSQFVRGFYAYDVRAAEISYSKISDCMIGSDSGARITEGGAVWSYGRIFDYDVSPNQADLTAAGVWIAPSALPFTWATAPYSWSDMDFPWGTIVNDVRRRLMARQLVRKSCWIEFKDAGGVAIGYARARAKHQVAAIVGGPYQVLATAYGLGTTASEIVYIEALTDFGNGNGAIAASAALRFGAYPTDIETPGALWLLPGQITLPFAAIASRAVNIPFGQTVRERVRTLLRITA